jgi:hypothetical protein
MRIHDVTPELMQEWDKVRTRLALGQERSGRCGILPPSLRRSVYRSEVTGFSSKS